MSKYNDTNAYDVDYETAYKSLIKEKRELEKKVNEYQDYIFFLLKTFNTLMK